MDEDNVILFDGKSKTQATYIYNLKDKSTEKIEGILQYFKQDDKFVKIFKI
ncbi:hypothetical protein [Clostridium ganghwense]|uniref:hypothetical protein n=1 Tax=Clostridium ganghwense TaxID=312089 RepID=UPI00227D54D5|nr:hypothetical protein [Clostridium ganghwense]